MTDPVAGIGGLVAGPAIEPVTSVQLIAQLRLPSDTAESLTLYIEAARRHCEGFHNRAYITQTWELQLPAFPISGVTIPHAPLQSVSSVKYLDTSGVLQTLAASVYDVDAVSDPGRLALAYAQVWPSTYEHMAAVRIRYVAGYGAVAADVPANFRQAILMKAVDLYEHRGDETADSDVTAAIERLLWMDRVVPV